MEYSKNWFNFKNNIIEVRCEKKNTVLLFNIGSIMLAKLINIEKELCINLVIVETLTDLLALPAFLAIIDPKDISSQEWDDHFQFIQEWLGPNDCSYLFVKKPDAKIPESLKRMSKICCTQLSTGKLKAIIKKMKNLSRIEIRKPFVLYLLNIGGRSSVGK